MNLKNNLSKMSSWLKSHTFSKPDEYSPVIDDQGLISQEPDTSEQKNQQPQQNKQVLVKSVQPEDKNQTLEKLQKGFDDLISQLKGINENLNKQGTHYDSLMEEMNKLPKLLESFPGVVDNQTKLTEQMLETLKANAAKQQQFVEAVEKIPTETAKQTDALVEIDHQLAAAADTDVQMAESFNNFNETMQKLDQTSANQTDSIMQMSKTFATSDRYLKYLMTRQNKRFMWIFFISMGVCVTAILLLVGIIIYLRH